MLVLLAPMVGNCGRKLPLCSRAYLPVDFLRVGPLSFLDLVQKFFFSATYAPSSAAGAAPLTFSSMTNHLPPRMTVSANAHLPKAAFLSEDSSPAKLLI